MSDFLFDDFHPIPEKQWKQKTQFDLNGKDYNQTLWFCPLDLQSDYLGEKILFG